ncbi:MAG TPA: hypothetical protein VFB68_02280 [Xanthobacteraceae bacterium]|nr:hypothetical protein [Xanthobacteraceae bacterium]
MNNEKGAAADAMARHLHAAIDRVREDVAKVEFWADAMTGFSEPVPDYESKDMKVWLPPEQATRIASANQNVAQKRSTASKRR